MGVRNCKKERENGENLSNKSIKMNSKDLRIQKKIVLNDFNCIENLY